MDTSVRKDVWAAGDLYEPYVGRWSRLVAQPFLEWLDLPPGKDWVDIGCGTGALSQAVLDHARPRFLTGIDPATAFVDHARSRVAGPNIRFEVGDARSLPLPDASADAAVSGLVLNFVPGPRAAVAEQVRVVRPAGTVAAYLWDYAGKMELMRYFWDAAVELDAGARELDEARRFPLCEPGPLAELFSGAGLQQVEVRAIEIPTVFRDFDDYWSPFLGGQGPAPGYAMSLSEVSRDLLRDLIKSRLPRSSDGTIRLVARAWAVRAQKPAA
jgi:SAM-dependent methyltransferase